MVDDKLVLVSVNQSSAKKLASVLTSGSAKAIMEALASGSMSEGDLAKKLGIPSSTVHHNIKVLSDVGLVESVEFHYSKKGRQVNHYQLTNKYVLVAPAGVSESVMSRLAQVLPAVVTLAVASVFVALFGGRSDPAHKLFAASADTASPEAMNVMMDESARAFAAPPVMHTGLDPVWFFVSGGLLVVLVFVVVFLLRRNK